MSELKPCPNCGGEVYLAWNSLNRKFIFYHQYPMNCRFNCFEMDWQTVKTIAEAIEAWNRRENVRANT